MTTLTRFATPWPSCGALLCCLLSLSAPARADGVTVRPELISPGEKVNDKAIIEFLLQKPAAVTVRVYATDKAKGGSTIVRTVIKDEDRPSGAHSVEWDGRNDSGQIVPNDAYTIRVVARSGGVDRKVGEVNVDVQVGQIFPQLTISPTVYDPSGGDMTISFSIAQKASVAVRILRAEGNEMVQVFKKDLGPRPPTDRETVQWDGRDDKSPDGWVKDGEYVCEVVGQVKVKANEKERQYKAAERFRKVTKLTISELEVVPRAFTPAETGKAKSAKIGFKLSDTADVAIRVLSPSGAEVWRHNLHGVGGKGKRTSVYWGGLLAGPVKRTIFAQLKFSYNEQRVISEGAEKRTQQVNQEKVRSVSWRGAEKEEALDVDQESGQLIVPRTSLAAGSALQLQDIDPETWEGIRRSYPDANLISAAVERSEFVLGDKEKISKVDAGKYTIEISATNPESKAEAGPLFTEAEVRGSAPFTLTCRVEDNERDRERADECRPAGGPEKLGDRIGDAYLRRDGDAAPHCAEFDKAQNATFRFFPKQIPAAAGATNDVFEKLVARCKATRNVKISLSIKSSKGGVVKEYSPEDQLASPGSSWKGSYAKAWDFLRDESKRGGDQRAPFHEGHFTIDVEATDVATNEKRGASQEVEVIPPPIRPPDNDAVLRFLAFEPPPDQGGGTFANVDALLNQTKAGQRDEKSLLFERDLDDDAIFLPLVLELTDGAGTALNTGLTEYRVVEADRDRNAGWFWKNTEAKKLLWPWDGSHSHDGSLNLSQRHMGHYEVWILLAPRASREEFRALAESLGSEGLKKCRLEPCKGEKIREVLQQAFEGRPITPLRAVAVGLGPLSEAGFGMKRVISGRINELVSSLK